MVMIEEYPVTNPNRDRIGDTPYTLNINIALNITRLSVASLCTLAGFVR
jgi:hypothetical protein